MDDNIRGFPGYHLTKEESYIGMVSYSKFNLKKYPLWIHVI